MKTIETAQDVSDAAAALAAAKQEYHQNIFVTAGEFMRQARWNLTSREAVGLALVVMGVTLPETYLLKCPAADWLRELSVKDQKKFVVLGRPFLVARLATDGQIRSYRILAKDLTEEDCKVLFQFLPKAPMCAASLDGDDVTFEFKRNLHSGKQEFAGTINQIHRDK